MLKLEIKNINAKSVFKTVIMASVIPAIIFLSFFIIIVALVGISSFESSEGGNLLLTIIYLALYFIIGPVFVGFLGMICAGSYNWLVKKFGGLKITCSEFEATSFYDLDSDTKNKIKILDRSYKEGILTEEEYNKKRDELYK